MALTHRWRRLSDPHIRYLDEQFRAGSWHPQLLQESWQQISHCPSGVGLCLYLDMLHCMRGASHEDLDAVTRLRAGASISDIGLELRLAAHRLHIGVTAEDDRNFPESLSQWPVLRNGFGRTLADYPMLLAYKARRSCSKALLTRRERSAAPAALQLERQLADLSDVLDRISPSGTSPMTIAVVGNGPGLLTHTCGDTIDACDLVIRFNRAILRPGLQARTGRRTDLWIMNPSTPMACQPADSKAMAISGAPLFIKPSRFWRAMASQCALPVARLPTQAWYAMVRHLAAPPSAGILALASLAAIVPTARLSLHGFSTAPVQGRARTGINHYADSGKASSRHNWHGEAEWLRQQAWGGG